MSNRFVAVLIDGENIDPSFAEKIFSFAASLGTVTVREIYGSGIALNAWSDPILKHTIHTNFTLRPNRFKNSSDIALVIGAMEILSSVRASGTDRETTVLIVSSDSDFSPLAVHLRAAGVDVVGMGEPKNTNPMWPKACTRYVELTGTQPSQAPGAERNRRGEAESQPAQEKQNAQPAKKSEPEGKKTSQSEQKSSAQEKKPVPAEPSEAPAQPVREQKKSEPAEQKKPAAPEQKGSEAAEQKKSEPAEQKIAPSHRARMEIIRRFITEQINARDGRVKSGELFKSLASLPDYKYDQQRSKRNPMDYLEKQYGAWFAFEAGEKGSSWISLKPAEAAQNGDKPASDASAPTAEAENASALAGPAAETNPAEGTGPSDAAEAPSPEPSSSESAPESAEEPAGTTLEESLTAAGIPFRDAVRAVGILSRCRNLRDVYNRMRGAFGKEDGKTYYEIVKAMVRTSAYSFPPREKEPARETDDSDRPLTKEEIAALTASDSATAKPASDEPYAEAAPSSEEDAEQPSEARPEEEQAEEPASGGTIRLTDGPVRFLLEKGVTSDRAIRIVSIFESSPNQRVAYNELRKAFGNKGRQYLGMMKEYSGETGD